MDSEKPAEKFMDTVKFVGVIAGGITGSAALFVLIGYIILLSFTQSVNIYNHFNIANHLPLEALFSFVFDGLRFLGSRFYHWIIFIVMLILLVWVSNVGRKHTMQINVFRWASIGLLLWMAYLIGTYDVYSVSPADCLPDVLLYIGCLPILIALGYYLALHHQHASKGNNRQVEAGEKPKNGGKAKLVRRGDFNEITLWFSLLLVFMPFFYGTRIYDLDLTTVVKLRCGDGLDTSDLVKQINGGLLPHAFLGHALDKSFLFTQAGRVPQITMVDNSNIRLLEVRRAETNTSCANKHELSVRGFLYSVASAPDSAMKNAQPKMSTPDSLQDSIMNFLN